MGAATDDASFAMLRAGAGGGVFGRGIVGAWQTRERDGAWR
jgi:hypothetical protein